MDKYTVRLYTRAYRDLDGIYVYIAEQLSEPLVAERLIESIEEAIFSLESFPERGSVRRIGAYADQGYRQLFAKNYVIVYRVLKDKKEVHVVAVRYAQSQF
ncbi:MAG: type II toxin-antitoxin system RelE/ParE family toxin [Clostridia bacterium]|nr:type II toxin-antitoxin system RelE/ParE family toxin [Clostridia bacterium]